MTQPQLLDDMLARLMNLPEDKRREIVEKVDQEREAMGMKWIPNPGRQTDAYRSKADVLLYGGQGGGGKSSILLGLALTQHKRSLIMRRHYTDLGALTDEVLKFNGTRSGFNGSAPPKLRTTDNRLVEFGACAHAGDEQQWQGQPHDFLGIDEAVQFLESQVRFLMGWVRSTETGQRTRVVMASNPPIDASGEWIIGMFRPWLDITHPNPAKPGELRWFVTDANGKDLEVDGPDPIEMDGRTLRPMSRTFIPASVDDNPFLAKTDYKAKLDALPEPIRSAVRDGNFMATRSDAEFQVIPTQWVIEAQARWKDRPPEHTAMTAMAIDPAGGGRDSEEIAMRYGGWFAPLVSSSGPETADGSITAANVVQHRRDICPVVVDVGGGYGGAVILRLRDNNIECEKFDGRVNTGLGTTKDGQLNFANKRAMAWWRMREELDPTQEGGSVIALPPDTELRADLCAPTWKLTTRGILIESKEDIKKRLGRSPGKGDAAVMTLVANASPAARMFRNGQRPKVVLGYQNRR